MHYPTLGTIGDMYSAGRVSTQLTEREARSNKCFLVWGRSHHVVHYGGALSRVHGNR